ncbi:MAG: sugar kinase [Chloroflexota bacterium]
MSPTFITLGEPLVEVMRDSVGVGLDVEGTFRGPYPSGAPAIVACAAARLGADAGFIGCVGDDDFGRCFRARCARDGVDTRLLVVDPHATTGTAFVTYFPDGSRRFVFHVGGSAAALLTPAMVDPAYFSGTEVVHITGSTLAISDGCREACVRAARVAKEAGAWVSFDPNLRPELLGGRTVAQVCAPILEVADILLPSGHEAALLAGAPPDADPATACQDLLDGAAHLVVLKEGAAGSTAFTAGGPPLHVPSFPVWEVDPTGAGDCFAAALLVGLRAGLPLSSALRRANGAGALATTRRGPMEGAPTAGEIDQFLAEGRVG